MYYNKNACDITQWLYEPTQPAGVSGGSGPISAQSPPDLAAVASATS